MSENNSEEQIVLPVNSGLRDAYISILKSVYSEQKREFWIQEIIKIVASDCGIDFKTAQKRCRNLSNLYLLGFVKSSIKGHLFRVNIYSKKDGEVFQVDNWFRLNRLIEAQFGDLVEAELIRIGKKFRSNSGLDRTAIESRLNLAIPIHEDISRSSFEQREKMTVEEVAEDFLRNLENTTSENRSNHKKEVADEIKVTSKNVVLVEK